MNLSLKGLPFVICRLHDPGRDFSGEVVDVGTQVKHLKVGDEVWGAIDAKRQGTHAEFCLASEKEISMKPKSISHVEAAALPFVAATTFSSLVLLGGLTEKITRLKRKPEAWSIYLSCLYRDGTKGIVKMHTIFQEKANFDFCGIRRHWQLRHSADEILGSGSHHYLSPRRYSVDATTGSRSCAWFQVGKGKMHSFYQVATCGLNAICWIHKM